MSRIDWWNDDTKTSNWALKVLPVLVRQARSQRPITYKAVAAEVGMNHHRPVQRAAGHIAYALGEIGTLRGWRKRPPPQLQSLIVNKDTGLPGHGVDAFMSRHYQQAKTKSQREAALLSVHGQIYAYPHWDDVMDLLEVAPPSTDLEALSDEATRSRGRGGEGPDHKALKEFVARNPQMLGLPNGHAVGKTEHPLPSGDQVDVVFAARGRMTAVEVKSHISERADVARGIYQCVKYRAVLEAQASVTTPPFDVSAMLVFGGSMSQDLRELANTFAVQVIDGVTPT